MNGDKARVAIAGALTAGALLVAPLGVAVAAPGVANAAPAAHKKIIHLRALKKEIKKVLHDVHGGLGVVCLTCWRP